MSAAAECVLVRCLQCRTHSQVTLRDAASNQSVESRSGGQLQCNHARSHRVLTTSSSGFASATNCSTSNGIGVVDQPRRMNIGEAAILQLGTTGWLPCRVTNVSDVNTRTSVAPIPCVVVGPGGHGGLAPKLLRSPPRQTTGDGIFPHTVYVAVRASRIRTHARVQPCAHRWYAWHHTHTPTHTWPHTGPHCSVLFLSLIHI